MASNGEETAASRGVVAALGRRARGLRLHWVSFGVLAIVVAATIGAFFLAHDLQRQSQSEALLGRAAETADALKAQESESSAILSVASAVAEATEGDPDRFRQIIETRLVDESVANVSLVRLETGTATAVATVGPRPSVLVEALTPEEVEQLQQIALGEGIEGVAFGIVGGERATLIAAPGTPDGRFAVTVEFLVGALEANIPAGASAGVDWALYAVTPLGTIPVVADTEKLPLQGDSVVRDIQAFGAEATLVVVADGSLVTGVRGYLKWLVLVFGLMLAAIAALIVEMARRRATAAEAHRSLEQQNERLRQLDRQKDEFISLVSHDLRTPLTSIIGYTELLLEEEETSSPESRRHFLEVVERNGHRLLGMVEDLLFMARLQAGRLQLDLGVVDLAQTAAECVEALTPKAEEAGIALRLETDHPEVYGDERRLGQLIDNLVSNALKFTLEGGVVTVRAVRDGRSAVLEVEDTGIGIPAGEVDQLFGRFYRASSATERELPGTGLGLTIAKAIVDAHHGTIAVESAEGVGTTFRIEIPSEVPVRTSGEEAPAPEADGEPDETAQGTAARQ
jgi:signal transduction histidine kinase